VYAQSGIRQGDQKGTIAHQAQAMAMIAGRARMKGFGIGEDAFYRLARKLRQSLARPAGSPAY
jgi:hypothetical protein